MLIREVGVLTARSRLRGRVVLLDERAARPCLRPERGSSCDHAARISEAVQDRMAGTGMALSIRVDGDEKSIPSDLKIC